MKRLFFISALFFIIISITLPTQARTIIVRGNNHHNHHSHNNYYGHYHTYNSVPYSYNISRNWNYHNQPYYQNTVQAYCNHCGHYHPNNYRSCPQPSSVYYYYSEY